jgi:ketosteroid isomerase-like protein
VNKFNIVMGWITVLAALICLWAPAARADDQQEISDLERKLAVMTNPDEIMKLWDSGDDDVVLFDVMTPREFAGHKAIHDDLAAFLPGNKDVKVDFLELKVISDRKLALASSVQHYTARIPKGNRSI